MRALPARRITLGALCAALLAGLTGPAAMAVEHDRAAFPAALLAQARTVEADEPGLAPVVGLLEAALEKGEGRLPASEARKLGDAAKDALAKAADEDPVTTAEPSSSVTITTTTTDDTAPAATEDDLTSEEMATLREVLDALLDLLRLDTGTTADAEEDTEADESATADPSTAQEDSLLDELLALVDDLVAELLGTGPQASTLPAPADPVQPPLLAGVTLPALPPVLLLPSS
ncbi:hypothetical protein ADK41_25305 [Streptomyces caelestis]|uniref:Secreted protein n=1 Tax=Streptomyces caelestis TaxID=36816 RepID=A0A0M8QP93_9ACTN|nr:MULTISPECIES: hypothetical protein [Streptomyces]KOT35286.1 hypothetical protein ADK41_25305 [Streptomyces caelestis]